MINLFFLKTWIILCFHLDDVYMDHRAFVGRVASLRPLGIGVEYYPNYVNRIAAPHSLDVVLISFILRGRGRHLIDGDIFPELGGASVAVTHYGQRHDIITGKGGMDVLNIYLDLNRCRLPVMPHALRRVLPLIIPLHSRFQHRLNRITRLQINDAEPMAACVFAIKRELEEHKPGYADAAMLQFSHFLIMCCRHALVNGLIPAEELEAQPQPSLEELRQYLDSHYHLPLTLAHLAKRTRLCPTYLCRAFKGYTGKRLFDYIIDRRIQAAMLALRYNDEKVLSIALTCGFNDLSYFNRKFKQFAGAAPSAYRKKFIKASI